MFDPKAHRNVLTRGLQANFKALTDALRQVQEGRPTLRRGPRAGDRLPDARTTRDGQGCWLGEALAAPGFHLLLCGPPGDWHPSQLTALRHRYPDTLTVHYLTREATPGALQDFDGQVFARLGVDGTAQYLVRPDGHIGYRCGGDESDRRQCEQSEA